MFLPVLKTKGSQRVSEDTLLVWGGRKRKEHSTTQQKRKRQKGGPRGLCAASCLPPAWGRLTPSEPAGPIVGAGTGSALGRNANPPSPFDSNI